MNSTKNEKLETVIKAVYSAGLGIYAALGKYKKICKIEHLEDDVIIDTCEAYLKYKDKIKGNHWPYFIRVLHTKHQTFKPKDTIAMPQGMMGIDQIIKLMMAKG